MYKQRSALILIAFGLFLTAEIAALLPGVRNDLFRLFTRPHLTFMSHASGKISSYTGEHLEFEWAADRANTTQLFVLMDLTGTPSAPSPLPVAVTVNAFNSNSTHDGIWINGKEQPLKPGVNAFYFSKTVWGRVNLTPSEAARIPNFATWKHEEKSEFSATLAKRLGASQTPPGAAPQ